MNMKMFFGLILMVAFTINAWAIKGLSTLDVPAQTKAVTTEGNLFDFVLPDSAKIMYTVSEWNKVKEIRDYVFAVLDTSSFAVSLKPVRKEENQSVYRFYSKHRSLFIATTALMLINNITSTDFTASPAELIAVTNYITADKKRIKSGRELNIQEEAAEVQLSSKYPSINYYLLIRNNGKFDTINGWWMGLYQMQQ